MQFFETFRHLFHPQRSNNHRPKVLHPDALFSFALIALGFWFVINPLNPLKLGGDVLGFASNITASQIVQQTNAERAKVGLPPLTVNDKLNAAALAKAQYMFSKQFWAHVAPDGTQPWKFFQDAGYRYSVAGENLARDFSNTNDVVAAWMASPTHRANMVNNRYREIGVAVMDGKLLGTDTTLVVQLFGTPVSGAPQISDNGQATQKDASLLAFIPPAQNDNAHPNGQPANPQPAILGSGVIPITTLNSSPLFSPLQLSKAFFLAIIFIVIFTLIYDTVIMSNRNTVRLVGKNFAHLLLFAVVGFLLILFKGGIIQ